MPTAASMASSGRSRRRKRRKCVGRHPRFRHLGYQPVHQGWHGKEFLRKWRTSMTEQQDDLFSAAPPSGRDLAEQGIDRSIKHAEAVEPGWKDLAFNALC